MESIHQIIEGKVLSQVINLPKSFQNILVEITVKPSAEKTKQTITREDLRAQFRGSHTESLSEVLKQHIDADSDVNLEELREERRTKKYECAD